MKKFLSLLAFGLLLVATVAAQGNGCGNGNSSNGGQSNGNSSNANTQQAPVTVTWQIAHRALQAAGPYFQQELNLNFGQLVVRYLQGICTVTLVATNPPTNNTYRVAIGGTTINVIIDNL